MSVIERIDVLPISIPRNEYLDRVNSAGDPLVAGHSGGSHEEPDRYERSRGIGRCVYPTAHEALFVRVITDDGLTGYGEALAPAVPEATGSIITGLLSSVIAGRDPLDVSRLWFDMYSAMRGRGHGSGFFVDAVTAVDMALWDIKGKALGLPLWKVLGGAFRDIVPVYVSGLGRSTAEERIDAAREWALRGIPAVKGVPVSELGEFRAALGDEEEILVDALWSNSYTEAFRIARTLGEHGVVAFECPLLPEAIDDHRRLRETGFVPIALGEAERTRFEFNRILIAEAADLLQPDIGRCGISEFVGIASLAESWNRELAPHESAGLSLCIAASIHCSAAIPNLYRLEYKPLSAAVANTLQSEPFVMRDGGFAVPDGVGLGVEPDWDQLERWRIL